MLKKRLDEIKEEVDAMHPDELDPFPGNYILNLFNESVNIFANNLETTLSYFRERDISYLEFYGGFLDEAICTQKDNKLADGLLEVLNEKLGDESHYATFSDWATRHYYAK